MKDKVVRHSCAAETTEKKSVFCCSAPLCLLLAFFTLIIASQDVFAARRRVIFQLANLHQWAELKYTYEGHGYGGETSRYSHNHKFEEKYHLDIDYVILGRRLANGNLDLDFGFDQNYEDESGVTDRNDSSEGFNVEYLVNMLVFEQSSMPIALSSSQAHERINEPFTASHDQTTLHNSASISLKNRILPAHINYSYSETETDGLAFDRQQLSEQLRLGSFLKIGDISTTNFHAEVRSRESWVEGPALDTATDTYSFEANNVMNWTALSQRQVLRSSFRKKKETGTSVIDSDQWDERLRLGFGKALESEFSHQYRRTESLQQFRREQEDDFWIEHRLFQSLISRYQYTHNRTDFDIGEEQSWQRQVGFSYNKRLPKESRVRASYSYSYGVTDRNLDSNRLTIGPGNPEEAQIDNFFEVTLVHPNVEVDSIVVSDEFGEIPDGSYEVRTLGSLTVLDFSGNSVGLGPDDDVLIEYDYFVNNSIEYSTTTNSFSLSMGLFKQSLRLFANLSRTNQDLIDGEANVSALVQQNYLQTGFEGSLKEYTYGANYSLLDSTISEEEFIEAFVSYTSERNGKTLNIRLVERYNSIKQNEGPGSGTIEKNSLMFHLNYRRKIARNSTMTLKAFLADIRGDNIEKDEARFGLLLESRWYKFLLRINADITFEYNDGQASHQEQVSIALRRYF